MKARSPIMLTAEGAVMDNGLSDILSPDRALLLHCPSWQLTPSNDHLIIPSLPGVA
jgi:hypothetical protein